MNIKHCALYGITVSFLALGVVLLVSPPASATFSGSYDVTNWTTTPNGTPPAGGGTIDTSTAPGLITIYGGDFGCDLGPCRLDFTIAAVGDGSVNFNWDYQTFDVDGPFFDRFGYLLNNVFTQLSDDSGLSSQSGNTLFTVAAGNIFGFWLDCTDCIFGGANVVLSEFSAPEGAPVPEPSTLLLLGSGLAGLAVWRRKKAA